MIEKKYFRKGPIRAVQFDGSQEQIKEYRIFKGYVSIRGNNIQLDIGDYIVGADNTDYQVVNKDVFERTYEELPVVPKFIDRFIEGTEMYPLADVLSDILAWDPEDAYFSQEESRNISWITNNLEEFTRAWLDGYSVEEING